MIAASIPAILAFIKDRPSTIEALTFLVMGMAVVLSVLAIMWIGTAVMGSIFTKLDSQAAKKATAAKEAAAEEQRNVAVAAAAIAATTQGPVTSKPAETPIVAIIAAAAHTILGHRARVISIRPAPTDWSAEGRRQIFASHRVR